MVQYDFAGRTAVVTGGAKGIGLGISQRLADSGAAVAVWDMNPDSLRTSAAGHPFEAILSVDVTEPASVEQAVQDTLAQLGVVDILVNNAGVAGPDPAHMGVPFGRLGACDRHRPDSRFFSVAGR